MPRVIITGGPGTGKTTLLHELAASGHTTIGESAREVIRERIVAGLSPRPEPAEFAAEILQRDRSRYKQVPDDQNWTFFDRSAVEAVGMVQDATPMPATAVAALLADFRFHLSVFILPPWPEIYVKDDERNHSFEHCIAVHQGLVSWYGRCGYQMHEVPRSAPVDRARHVLRILGEQA